MNRSILNDNDRSVSTRTTKDKRIDNFPLIVHLTRKTFANDSNSLNIRGKSSNGRNQFDEEEFYPNEFPDKIYSKSKQMPRRRRSSSFKNSNRN